MEREARRYLLIIELDLRPVGSAIHASVSSLASATEYLHLVSEFRADGSVLSVTRAATDSAARLTPATVTGVASGRWVQRTFSYDNAGRAYLMKYPGDPDWQALRDPGDSSSAPSVQGSLTFNDFGQPTSSAVHLGGVAQTVLASASYDAWGAPTQMRVLADSASTGITQTFTYDRVHRPLSARVERGGASGVSSGTVATQGLNAVRVPFFETYDWDRASNLMRVTSNAGPDVFPSQYRRIAGMNADC